MMEFDPRKTMFLQTLRLFPDLTDEECTHAVSDLISRATSEQPCSPSLDDIYDAVSRYDYAAFLEPLYILPTLLPCRQNTATYLIQLCAEKSNPKEVLIVVQEAIEYLQTRLNRDEDEDEDEEEEDDATLVQRTIGIVALCPPAIARSNLGRRSALDLCSPVLENLTSLIPAVSPLCTRDDSRTLVTGVAGLVKYLHYWATQVTDADGLRDIKSLLCALLDTTVVSCSQSAQTFLALGVLGPYLPRSYAQMPEAEWQDAAEPMDMVQLTLECMGMCPEYVKNWTPKSFSDLIYLAHSSPPFDLSSPTLPDLLVSALQANVAVEEAVYLLFEMLKDEKTRISPELTTSLCTVFRALASTHPDSTTRLVHLRMLSLTLSKLPPLPRLDMLLSLTTDDDFLQIRGPAVGLLKEAVLEALALPSDQTSPFASPELLRIFGPVLFRPNPPAFFSEPKTNEELAQSLELLRIADCLSFYYVLLQRDHENKTGVRSKNNVMNVERSILGELRRFLDVHVVDQEQPLMAILSLKFGLDRIDGALLALGLESV